MKVINETIKIEIVEAEAWLDWMRQVQLPEILSSPFVKSCIVMEVPDEDEEARTFAVHYNFAEIMHFNHYVSHNMNTNIENQKKAFGGKYLNFKTVLDVIIQAE